jgi:hypothetical protein
LSGRCIPLSCHNLFVCRRIRRRSTDLVLFRLAGAFPAEPPLIWCCSVWPAHSPPSRHQFGVVPFGRRIPRRFGLFVCRRIRCQPTDLVLLHLAGSSPRCATIAYLGWRIPSPIFLPAHPIAAPPLPILAVASPRRATIAYIGWRIPSPCHHRSFWPAHPLAMPPLPT